MCISTAALAAFLTLVGAENVTTDTDQIIVHAEERDALWRAQVPSDGDLWCTDAPQIDAEARLLDAAE